jgi:hypothetical protein
MTYAVSCMTRRPSPLSESDNSKHASGHSDLQLNTNDVLFRITIPKHKQQVYSHKQEWIVRITGLLDFVHRPVF